MSKPISWKTENIKEIIERLKDYDYAKEYFASLEQKHINYIFHGAIIEKHDDLLEILFKHGCTFDEELFLKDNFLGNAMYFTSLIKEKETAYRRRFIKPDKSNHE